MIRKITENLVIVAKKAKQGRLLRINPFAYLDVDYTVKPGSYGTAYIIKDGKYGLLDSNGKKLLEALYSRPKIDTKARAIVFSRQGEKLYYNFRSKQITSKR